MTPKYGRAPQEFVKRKGAIMSIKLELLKTLWLWDSYLRCWYNSLIQIFGFRMNLRLTTDKHHTGTDQY